MRSERQRAELAAFVDNYRWLRREGISHEEIAARLGVRRESLIRRLERAGVDLIPEPADRPAVDRLAELIEQGVRFSSNDLPLSSSAAWALAGALRRGRIVRVGTSRGARRKPIGVYVAAAAAEVA